MEASREKNGNRVGTMVGFRPQYRRWRRYEARDQPDNIDVSQNKERTIKERRTHSFATGPVIAEPFISPLLFTITPALSFMHTDVE